MLKDFPGSLSKIRCTDKRKQNDYIMRHNHTQIKKKDQTVLQQINKTISSFCNSYFWILTMKKGLKNTIQAKH